MKQRGKRYCPTCASKLQKRGKTKAGTQRWYCPTCAVSAIKTRPDLRRGFIFQQFVDWLLGKLSQDEISQPGRTFRRHIAWCWLVPIPPVLTGEIHHAVILDGITVGGQVCLIVRTTEHVLGWLWVPYESSEYWSRLLRLLPAPRYVVCDGQKGLLKALALCWPATTVQRCRFHAWLNIRQKLTLDPTSKAGRELLKLARTLLHVRTRRHARRWKRQLRHWRRKHDAFVRERTVKPDPLPRQRPWRYTHERLRSAYRQLDHLSDDLLRSSYRPSPSLPSTTNHVEGGINSQLRTLLKHHRGMTDEHQRVLVNWYLYGRSEEAKPPRFVL